MESSDESLDVEPGEQIIMNKDKTLERKTDLIDSTLANSILSTTLRSNRAKNEMQENGFICSSELVITSINE